MIKHTNGWEIAKKLKPECKVFVRNFPGSTTQCMATHETFDLSETKSFYTLRWHK